MSRPGTKEYAAEKIYKAVFKRKTTQGRINVLIDAVADQNVFADEALHALNEIVIHKHPRQHIRNTLKYTVKPRAKQLIDRLIP